MNRSTTLLATTLSLNALLSATGCVNGGTVALDTTGEVIRFSGQILLGVDEHGEEEHEEEEKHEEEGEPITAFPIALVVGADGIAGRTSTGAEGEFAFDVPPGEYHLGFSLPGNFADSGAARTDFLIHAEASEEPVGFEVVLVPEPEEGAWHIHGHIFDDEDGNGLRSEDEAILEVLEVDVPFGSQQDLVLNPKTDSGEPEDEGHGHTHG